MSSSISSSSSNVSTSTNVSSTTTTHISSSSSTHISTSSSTTTVVQLLLLPLLITSSSSSTSNVFLYILFLCKKKKKKLKRMNLARLPGYLYFKPALMCHARPQWARKAYLPKLEQMQTRCPVRDYKTNLQVDPLVLHMHFWEGSWKRCIYMN